MPGTHAVHTAERFFDGQEMHGPTRVIVENGTVTSVRPHRGECEHHLVAPGFVDLQVNGWDTVDFSTAGPGQLAMVDSSLARLGTTTYLATLVSDTLRDMAERISLLHRSIPSMAGCAGIHLEGPFLGQRPGAHRLAAVTAVDLGWIESLPSSVRMLTMAAEQADAARATANLVRKGTVVSVGHSAPTAAEFENMVSAGASMVTHLFNAMSGIEHRKFGVALAALTDTRLRAGLIADMQHVSPQAVRLAFAARPDGICLVSDSVGWSTGRFADKGITVQGGAPRLTDGTLAGSSTCLAECVRRAVLTAGVDTETVLRAATSIPAEQIGLRGPGRIVEGLSCDMVMMDPDLCVTSVARRLVSLRDQPTDD